MEIRRSIPDDATAIAKMESTIFDDPWREKDIFSYITSQIGMCYTALENGEVIGYIIGQKIPPEGEVYRIAVREDKRRCHVGNKLLTYALDSELRCGVEVVFLEVRSQNNTAIEFYKHIGFNYDGIREDYYQNPKDDAIVMVIRQ